MKYLSNESFSVYYGGARYEGGIVLDSIIGYKRVIEASTPPRLLGSDCGCVRTKTEKGWRLEVCRKHAAEKLEAFGVY